MSVRMMADVWENGPIDPTEHAVLLYLANRCDDDGKNCFPSKTLIAKNTRYSERTVQRVLIILEKGDWLSVFRGNGRGVVSQYELNTSKIKGRQGVQKGRQVDMVKRETRKALKGDNGDIKGRQGVQKRETMTTIPHTPYKEETSLNTIDTPIEPSEGLVLFSNEPEFPEWLPVATWNNYVAMRKKIKKPMTDDAKRLAIMKLDKLRKMGHPAQLVLEESIMNSWQGLFELKPEKLGNGGNRNGALPNGKGDHNLELYNNFDREEEYRSGALKDGNLSRR